MGTAIRGGRSASVGIPITGHFRGQPVPADAVSCTDWLSAIVLFTFTCLPNGLSAFWNTGMTGMIVHLTIPRSLANPNRR